MRLISILLLVILMIGACQEPEKEVIKVYHGPEEEQIHKKFQVIHKWDTILRHGPYKEFYEDSTLKEVAVYQEGKLHDQHKLYNKKGELMLEENYKNGNLHGSYKEYYTNGKLKKEGQYKDGDKEGKWTYYFPTGKVDKEVHFKNDNKDGTFQSFYNSGQLKAKGQYSEGEKVGKWEYYAENGRLKAEGKYKKKGRSMEKVYDTSGHLDKIVRYRNGEHVNTKEFN